MTKYHSNVNNSTQALQAYGKLKSVWSEESALRTKVGILQLQQLEAINTELAKPLTKQSSLASVINLRMRSVFAKLKCW